MDNGTVVESNGKALLRACAYGCVSLDDPWLIKFFFYNFRYQNGELVEVSSDPEHYEGGTPKQPSLLIRNSSRTDLGVYSCVVQNLIGATQSETVAYVNVLCK